jgi:hypothetical protein
MRWFLSLLLTIFLIGFGSMTAVAAALAGLGWTIMAIVQAVQLGFAILPVIVVVVVLGVPLYFVVVGLHELGHLLGVWAVRFRLHRIVVGPLGIELRGKVYRFFRYRPVLNPPGLVASHAVGSQRLRARYAVVVGGGPLASLVFAALFFGAALALNDPLQTGGTPDLIRQALPRNLTSATLGCAAWLNLFLAFITLTPGQGRTLDTDGAKLLELLWGGKAAERRLLTMLVAGYAGEGIRPRDWQVVHVERLLAVRDGSERDVFANFLGYYHALDCGQAERAGELLDLALSQRTGCPLIHRAGLLLEGAFYEGYYRTNAAAARSWLHRPMSGPDLLAVRLRAEAALLFSEGRYAEAIRQAEVALMTSVRSANSVDADLLCAFLIECRRRVAGSQEEEHGARR